jgi:hypothetical protein
MIISIVVHDIPIKMYSHEHRRDKNYDTGKENNRFING